jgi:hypothetical protein
MTTVADVDLLERAAAKSVPVRLTAVVGGQERTYRARVVKVVGADAAEGANGFWVNLLDHRAAGADALERERPECRGTFAVDQARFTFLARVIGRDRHLWVNDRVMFDALLLAPARDLRRVDQRDARRLAAGESSGVGGQLCRVVFDPLSTTQRKAVPIAGALQDLSADGAGFVCRANRHLTESAPDEPMRIAIQFRGRTITLAARLTQVSVISHRTTRAGVVFDWQDPETAASRAALDAVLAELERQESLRRAQGCR